MSLQAATVEILMEKAKFPPQTAVAVAEAIDMEIARADLITVPILDVRFARVDVHFAEIDARFTQVDARLDQLRSEVKADMQEIKAELVRWVLLAMLGSIALSGAASAVVNALQHVQ